MGLDVRLPLGLLFVIIGALLAIFGAVSDPSIYARSLGINVNLWWGLFMLITGTMLLCLSRRQAAVMHSSEESLEGAAIEELEQVRGLEGNNERTIRSR